MAKIRGSHNNKISNTRIQEIQTEAHKLSLDLLNILRTERGEDLLTESEFADLDSSFLQGLFYGIDSFLNSRIQD